MARVIRGWYSIVVGLCGSRWCGSRVTWEAKMPSGRLAFATRRVDIMAASMRAVDSLYGRHSPPKAWEKVDQMVVRVQRAPVFLSDYQTPLANDNPNCRNIFLNSFFYYLSGLFLQPSSWVY